MQRLFSNLHLRSTARDSLITLMLFLFGTLSLSAYPAKGTAAPSLSSLQLLQAPPAARASWPALKGKVVVLEFWATWCSPCIASLPHFNELVASLDPAKFQFLSIDDENLNAVQTFLRRKKISGWVGVDRSDKVFARYGVKARPTTIIVDANGKVVAVTEIDSVNTASLQAVAEKKKVAFKPAEEIIDTSAASAGTLSKPLHAVSITKAAPDAAFSQVNHPPTGTDFLGEDADSLFNSAFNIFGARYVLAGKLPDGHYNLRTNFADVPHDARTTALQQSVLSALHLQIQPKTITKRAYILRSTAASKTLLSPSASSHAMKRGSWHGVFILMNGTMDDLAYILATGLETPVINETGISGTFDARFRTASSDIQHLNATLQKQLGLELVPSPQERSITVLEVSRKTKLTATSSSKAQEAYGLPASASKSTTASSTSLPCS